MNLREMNWSKAEKETARRAFARAYRKECGVIVAKIREMAATAVFLGSLDPMEKRFLEILQERYH